MDEPQMDWRTRRAGVLLHITSLPGNSATGDLGGDAFRFVDFLSDAALSVWQMLPIGPTQFDGSPYQTRSSHAGDPRLIALEPLAMEGWVGREWLDRALTGHEKGGALELAWEGFQTVADEVQRQRLRAFSEANAYWLDDYALFSALHTFYQDRSWWQWPEGERDRLPEAMARACQAHQKRIDYIRFEQYLFFSQWQALKRYANDKGVLLFGDMPIFVAHDSAEVWARRGMFLFDEQGQPTVVAGVPPDYFSETGQRWGNPLYDWEQMEGDDFAFWTQRIKTQLALFDLIRIDHFRGFDAYWEIPAEEGSAINGRWVKAPGERLFDTLHRIYDPLPLVAEDLGIITPEVEALRDRFDLPGMKILQFAFSGDHDNPYLPERHGENAVVYTGTHDNDTTLGWYRSLDERGRELVRRVIGESQEPMPWPLVRTALASTARMAILPMQDLLALGSEDRMNVPGTTEGNWVWRFRWEQVDQGLAGLMRSLVKEAGRHCDTQSNGP